jgi:hypothetical protein
MGILERDICPEGDWWKAGEALIETKIMTSGKGSTLFNTSRKDLMREKAARWGGVSGGKSRVVAEEKAGYQLTEREWAATVTCEHGTSTHGIICETSEHVKFVTDPYDNRACGIMVPKCVSIKDVTNDSIGCQIANNVIDCSMRPRFAVMISSGDNTRLLSIAVYEGTMNVNRLQITQIVYVGTCCRLTRAENYCGNTVSVTLLNE